MVYIKDSIVVDLNVWRIHYQLLYNVNNVGSRKSLKAELRAG
jgi:hypothetical protein